MKKIIALGALVSLVMLAGCANNGTSTDTQAAAANSAQTSAGHHDYKGESLKK